MAKKAILDIDVQDDKFKAFYDVYQKFQSQLEDLPDSTKAAFGAFAVEVDKLNKGAKGLAPSIEKSTRAQKGFHAILSESERSMKRMVHSSAQVAKNIFGIGKFMMKLTTAGAGLGMAGLWGLDALGRSAVTTQRTARGLGLNQGQVRAFGTDFSRFLNPNTLQNTASAQADFTKRAYLALAAGVSYQQAGTMSVDELSIKSAMRAHDWWVNTPANLRTQQSLTSAGFGQIGYSMEDMRRLGNTPMSELLAAQSQYRKDVGTLGVGDKQTQEWYNLTRIVTLAGQKIETELIDKLAKLAPTISKVVDVLSDDLKAMIGSISDKDIEQFGNAIREFGKLIIDILKKTGHVVSAFSPSTPSDRQQYAINEKIEKANSDFYFSSILPLKLYPSLKTQAEKEYYLTAVEQKYKLPKGMLGNVWDIESSRGKNAGVSSAGAIGDFQLMPATATAHHVDPNSFRQSGMAAGYIFSQNLKRYKGDVHNALAAYNWGSGNLEKDIAAHGKNWEQFAPEETRNYISKYDRLSAPTVNIVVTNKTGSNVAVSANAMGH